MTLFALVTCGEGRQASLATRVLSYTGPNPSPAVIWESMALTPTVSGTIGHCTLSPTLPPGLTLDGQTGVISGTSRLASGSATYMVNASGAGKRASFPLVLSVTEPPNKFSYPSPAAGSVGNAPRAIGSISRRHHRTLCSDAGSAPGSGARQQERRHRWYAQRREFAGPFYDHGKQSGR